MSIVSMFWFAGIFLFAKGFYKENTIYIVMLFSFIIGMSHMTIAIVDSYFAYVIRHKEVNENSIYFSAVLRTMIYTSFMMFLLQVVSPYLISPFRFSAIVAIIIAPVVGDLFLNYRKISKLINEIKSKDNGSSSEEI